MAPQAILTAGVLLATVSVLVTTRVGADLVFAGALTALLASGVLDPQQALAGFGNQGLIAVGVLYIVAAGLRETGAVYWISQRVLGRPTTTTGAQLRVMAPVSIVSAFLNNTPVVAIMIPAISDWAKKHHLSASKLMLPLSYAAILGGSMTLIGTSTNLIVNGLLLQDGHASLGLFSLAWVGVPMAATGILATLLLARWLLPDRTPVLERQDNAREYAVEMTVAADGPLVGRTIEQAGLRNLGHVYLAEIDRQGRVLPAVGPSETLLAHDRLIFVGVVDSVVDLQRIPGLLPAPDQLFKLDGPRSHRSLVEAVVSDSCPLIGQTIREGRFRNLYGAVVIAVARNNQRIDRKIGDITLRPGDTLLLETQPDFVERQRNTRDFYLVSHVPDSNPPRFDRAPLASGILLGMVLVIALGWLPLVTGALLAAAAMVLIRALPGAAARRAIDWRVLIVIGSALGIGQAMTTTGIAANLANGLGSLAGGNPFANLLLLYLTTALVTALITNNAAAVLMYPIANSMASQLHASILPFAITLMLAASASFATPIGYQTNLMVLGPGGYHFNDFLRIGIPITLVTAGRRADRRARRVALLPAQLIRRPPWTPPPDIDLPQLLERATRIAQEAGAAILEIYARGAIEVVLKDDASPLTQADLASHQRISHALRELTPAIPILSEEAANDAPYPVRRSWTRFWLVDPLDGTKEFIKRNGEFTVNIALIEEGRPILGVVHAPALALTYAAAEGVPAARSLDEGTFRADPDRTCHARMRAHRRGQPLARRAPRRNASSTPCAHADRSRSSRRGSALKICQVADGTADLYPRLGPTMEWDTAAAHAVATQAGAHVVGKRRRTPHLQQARPPQPPLPRQRPRPLALPRAPQARLSRVRTRSYTRPREAHQAIAWTREQEMEPMTSSLIPPHGGTLVDRRLDPTKRAAALDAAKNLPKIPLDERTLADIECLATGIYSPLQGFVTERDYRSIVDDGRLENGLAWPIPITLQVTEDQRGSITTDQDIALTDANGTILATMTVTDVYRPDQQHEAQQVYGTTDTKHPGVHAMLQAGPVYLGGPITLVGDLPSSDFDDHKYDPNTTRQEFERRGWTTVVAFQTRNPIHRAHEYLTKVALETTDGLFINPLVGTTKADDIPADVRMQCYQVLLDNYYPQEPRPPRRLPRRHALRRPPRSHPPRHQPPELRLQPLHRRPRPRRRRRLLRHLRRPTRLRHLHHRRTRHPTPQIRTQLLLQDLRQHGQRQELPPRQHPPRLPLRHQSPRHARQRRTPTPRIHPPRSRHHPRERPTRERETRMSDNGKITANDNNLTWHDHKITKQERAQQKNQKPCVIWFTGLSGSGKSTLANALEAKLVEMGHHTYLLDGDNVRHGLNKDLGFSDTDRIENIRRIGESAKLFVDAGLIVLTAFISPFKSDRQMARSLVDQGEFIEVHVDAPLETCEERDPKGLYAKARAGQIKQFTGIDSPYEAPETPEVRLATSEQSVASCVDSLVSELHRRAIVAS